jgi:hypothetical protein
MTRRRKEAAAMAIADLCYAGQCQQQVLEAGAVPPLVQLVGAGSHAAACAAAVALGAFSRCDDPAPAQAVLDAGGVSPLVQLLGSLDPEQDDHALAEVADVMPRLCRLDADQALEAGLPQVLVGVLASKPPPSLGLANALWLLGFLAECPRDHEVAVQLAVELQQAVMDEEGLLDLLLG